MVARYQPLTLNNGGDCRNLNRCGTRLLSPNLTTSTCSCIHTSSHGRELWNSDCSNWTSEPQSQREKKGRRIIVHRPAVSRSSTMSQQPVNPPAPPTDLDPSHPLLTDTFRSILPNLDQIFQVLLEQGTSDNPPKDTEASAQVAKQVSLRDVSRCSKADLRPGRWQMP